MEVGGNADYLKIATRETLNGCPVTQIPVLKNIIPKIFASDNSSPHSILPEPSYKTHNDPQSTTACRSESTGK